MWCELLSDGEIKQKINNTRSVSHEYKDKKSTERRRKKRKFRFGQTTNLRALRRGTRQQVHYTLAMYIIVWSIQVKTKLQLSKQNATQISNGSN